jgi:hypothetical protein
MLEARVPRRRVLLDSQHVGEQGTNGRCLSCTAFQNTVCLSQLSAILFFAAASIHGGWRGDFPAYGNLRRIRNVLKKQKRFGYRGLQSSFGDFGFTLGMQFHVL